MNAENVRCPECGTINESVKSFCEACGAPLWVPEKPGTTDEPPANALETWKKATDEWRDALIGDEPDVLFWGHIASLLTLAVTYAGTTHFPRAHAHLAIALLSLGKDVDAEREANIALEQDPNEFRALQVRVVLALNKELLREERLSRLIPFIHRRGERSGEQSFTNFKRNAKYTKLDPTLAACDVNPECLSPQSSLVAELERIVAVFRNLCDAPSDVDEYLNLADFLIMVADGMRKMPLVDWRARLYNIVAHTPIEKLNCEGREQEVEVVQQRARLGSLLFELKPEQRVARRRSSSKLAFLQ
jgi:hypothetical protein